MQLSQCAKTLQTEQLLVAIQHKKECVISGIAYDSREVQKGSVFVAIKGKQTNGEMYIQQAISAGAIAIIAESLPSLPSSVTGFLVRDARKALAYLANEWYGCPSEHIHLIGVTGTNGKTSVSWFVQQMLRQTGSIAGVIGTTGQFVDDIPLESKRNTPTTPESLELQDILREMIKQGADDVVMEVSSMALTMQRTAGCRFSVGVFTNLTPDHLDDHGSMEAYKEAKLQLFPICPTSVVNVDDPHAQDVINVSQHVYTYGMTPNADFWADDAVVDMKGVTFTLCHEETKHRVHVPVSGIFTVHNTLAAAATCYALGVEWEQIVDSISAISGVRGRMETIRSEEGFQVIVDYAHTADALEHVLQTVKMFAARRVLLVFGCGGDRDPSKRMPMGTVAEKYADCIWITSDNPRSEDPMTIIQQIEAGLSDHPAYQLVEDRERAIQQAIEEAKAGDVVIVAGKGHETYQIIGSESSYFDDAAVVRSCLGILPVEEDILLSIEDTEEDEDEYVTLQELMFSKSDE